MHSDINLQPHYSSFFEKKPFKQTSFGPPPGFDDEPLEFPDELFKPLDEDDDE